MAEPVLVLPAQARPGRPSPTIQAQPGPNVGPFHWEDRRLRLLEIKRLQTFPDDYEIVGSRRSGQIQIGNAVPPLLAERVARALVESAELGALARMEEVADRLSMFATYFDRPELINEQLERYLAVDAAAIQAVARQVFRPDNLAVITYVPAEPAEEAA